jgi:hypothetical protein
MVQKKGGEGMSDLHPYTDQGGAESGFCVDCGSSNRPEHDAPIIEARRTGMLLTAEEWRNSRHWDYGTGMYCWCHLGEDHEWIDGISDEGVGDE